MLAEDHSVALYTDSQSAKTVLKNVELHPPVMPGKAAAQVYAGSKINLNISLKGMEGGTPLRIMDIIVTRKRIAEAGYKKVLAGYTYEKKLKQLIEWVEGKSQQNGT